MDELVISGKGNRSIWGILLLLAGSGLFIAGAVARNPDCLIGSAVPLLLGLTLWLSHDRPIRIHLTEESLEVHNPAIIIPLAEIQSVVVIGQFQSARFAIEVAYPGGTLFIPAATTIPSREIFEFLNRVVGQSLSLSMPDGLEKYRTIQENKFGSEKILEAGISKGLSQQKRSLRPAAFWLGLAAGGILWIIGGTQIQPENTGLFYWGIGFTILGGLIGSLLFFMRSLKPRNLPAEGGIVVSPMGFALIDGQLKGEMAWGAVLDLMLHQGKTWTGEVSRLEVKVAGATIVIQDIFSKPLKEIYPRMFRLWKPDSL
ncbi:MAG: hypothetical protein EXR99_11195 [Gemmataceae bacterium]|nr:hypothetical protein [Gemmataceae bacterium]